MVGTATVAQGGGSGEGSGVDFTEYRVNTDGATGDWVKSDNTAGADPFDDVVHGHRRGRSRRRVPLHRQGRQPGGDQVGRLLDRRARTRTRRPCEAFADPSTGAAPLLVQFSATGLDPQGGPLIYEWDFGDGGGSFSQSPEHTYVEPGTYTATVTVTDPQGKTGTDSVDVVVSPERQRGAGGEGDGRLRSRALRR